MAAILKTNFNCLLLALKEREREREREGNPPPQTKHWSRKSLLTEIRNGLDNVRSITHKSNLELTLALATSDLALAYTDFNHAVTILVMFPVSNNSNEC